jgi:hypothetical protein
MIIPLTLPRVSLGLVGTTFLGFGIAFLLVPERMAEVVELEARTSRPLIEIRAMYGGFEVGLGVFFLVAIARTRWIRAALAAQILGLGGLAVGRIYGMAATSADRLMVLFAGLEIAGVVLGIVAFRAAKTALINARAERRTYD